MPGSGAAPTTFNILDGWLDSANLSERLTRHHVRPGSLTEAKMVGQTAHYDLLGSASDDPKNYIPGGTLTFYNRREWGFLVATWQVVCASDGDNDINPPNMSMRVFVDGSEFASLRRYIVGGVMASSSSTDRRARYDRIWSGHVPLTGLSVGWHTIGLATYHEINGKQIRARIRNMKIAGIW